MAKTPSEGYAFGAFAGVFTPSILTVIGVIMYLRFGWVLGNLGLPATLFMVTLGSSITLFTAFAISALATNRKVEAGGAYHMLSRAFGAEAGAAIGIPLFLSQAVSVTFYAAGFAESLQSVLAPLLGFAPDARFLAAGTILAMALLASFSATLAIRAQYAIMACIVLSLLSFFFGRAPDPATLSRVAADAPRADFWAVFAVFFPAVTGILSGVSMSGDLRDPRRAIPRGTIAAVLVGYAIYMAVPVALARFVPDDAVLRGDMTVFAACARVRALVLLGIWAATLSSALGCMLAAPRTLQALARDRLAPRLFARGLGAKGDPVPAAVFAFAVAVSCAFIGPIDLIAPILTMVNLATYGLLNLSAALETAMGAPSWRPTFRVPSWVLFLGAGACLAAMLLIGPGQALLACLLVAAIYWATARRALRARWGDMRDGLAASLVRVALRRLSRPQASGRSRNWRPNLLVFAGDPARHAGLVALADALSGNRSLATIAAVVPERYWTAARAAEMGAALSAALDARGLEACVRVQPGDDPWAARVEMVRTYGFGPIEPNTVLVDLPSDPEGFAGLARLALAVAGNRRNLVVVQDPGDGAPPSAEPRIDLWWRGRYQNGGFMLALAWLVAASSRWRGARIRLCSICGERSEASKYREAMEEFLRDAHVEGDVLVLPPEDGACPLVRIPAVSADADLVLLGLPFARPLADGAPPPAPDAWARAAQNEADALRALPRVLYALAAEDLDFHSIFSA